MRDVRNRNRIRALLYSRATLFGLGCVVVLLAVAVWNMYHTYRVATEKRADAKAEYESLAAHSGDLEERIARLQTARGRESRIREDFGLAREGEAMIIVTGAPDNQDREHVKKPGFFGAVLQSVRRFFE